ncbi:MAG: T9SS type A sorting domain-containing protein [Bacteroidetes bacterium]|nr:T9SS type A sorting domain-containing protein [Bacteroidota bacterium]
MKKLLLGLLALGTCYTVNSQVLYNQTFDGIPGPTAGGAGTYAFPSGMLLHNVDNRTPVTNVNYVNEAWERREDFQTSVVDSVAFATSWYTPAGAANDWMWTPLIGPLPANATLSWNAKNYDPLYLDSYEVRIMTSPDVPTGGTGNIGNLITNSTVIYSTPGEPAAWTAHSVSLSSYAGQSVYIGYRLTSTDKFLLVVDDIKVEVVVNFDAQLVSTDTITEYTQIPLSQVSPLPFGGNVRNNGASALTNVVLNVNVTNSANASVYAASSAPLSSLAPGASMDVTIPAFTPSVADTYTVKYNVTATEVDQVNTNDTLYDSFVITDTIYARDKGIVTGGLGIGAGEVAYLGQQFEVVATTNLTSVTLGYIRGYIGRQYAAVVWNMAAGLPSAIIASTDTLLYPDNNALFTTVDISGGSIILTPGDYVITAVEFDSTLQLAHTSDIFTPGKTWVNWPSSPLAGWGNPEAFGANFAKAYQLRANFGPLCSNTTATDVQNYCGPYTWIDGNTYTSSNNTATFTIPNAGGCDSLITLNLTINATSTGTDVYTTCYPLTWIDGNTYSTSNNTAVFQLTNSVGCDSIVTLNLTITAPDDLTTTVTNETITANATGVTYQWLDCGNNNTPISGETNQSYTATSNGNYAVVITGTSCSDTSACVAINSVGIRDNGNSSLVVSLYPNPNTGDFTINLKETSNVVITDALGRVIMDATLNSGSQKINLSDEVKGIYFVKVSSKNGSTIKKVTINK